MRAGRVPVSRERRRHFVRRAVVWLPVLLAARRSLAGSGPYPQTLAALAHAYQRETDAHRRYAAFAERATREGYKGIAYMFSAFAASEAIHARNFRTLIGQLGTEPAPAPTVVEPGDTKSNLIAAVDDEIDSIDKLYPDTLRLLQAEGHASAIRYVEFAWQSERQHRDLIQKIRRYSPLLFERVAREIDSKTGLYFVCQTCGSTLHKVPQPACPVCASPSERYRQVPLPG